MKEKNSSKREKKNNKNWMCVNLANVHCDGGAFVQYICVYACRMHVCLCVWFRYALGRNKGKIHCFFFLFYSSMNVTLVVLVLMVKPIVYILLLDIRCLICLTLSSFHSNPIKALVIVMQVWLMEKLNLIWTTVCVGKDNI